MTSVGQDRLMGMPTVIVTEFVTLDGVMEAPGGEPTHPFTGWVSDYFTEEFGALKHQEVVEADAHLLGRVTYESFAGAWPTYEGAMADRMNSFPKYVVSTTLRDPEWNNTTVVPDLDAVRELDGTLLVAGSATLVHALLDADMVDELRLSVFPVTIGDGLRVFPPTHKKSPWQRVESRDFSTGIRVDTYKRRREAS
jgi:dihydrofolate reductase